VKRLFEQEEKKRQRVERDLILSTGNRSLDRVISSVWQVVPSLRQ